MTNPRAKRADWSVWSGRITVRSFCTYRGWVNRLDTFEFGREFFEDCLERLENEFKFSGIYDVTNTMIDRGLNVRERVYFIPFDRLMYLVIYSTVDVTNDRSPVEFSDRLDIELYWVRQEDVSTQYALCGKVSRGVDLYERLRVRFSTIRNDLGGCYTRDDWENGMPYVKESR